MLLVGGHKYTVMSKRDAETRWKCAFIENKRYLCKAKATTYKDFNNKEQVVLRGYHYHQPK